MISWAFPFSLYFLHRLGKNVDLKGNLGLYISASYTMQSYEYLGVGSCGAFPIKGKGKSSKKFKAIPCIGYIE
jgi:hypothetical protein